MPSMNEVFGTACSTLVAHVLRNAPDHVAVADAPGESLAQLREAWREALGHGRPVPVWNGASDATIWPDAATNHAFRAYHDLIHVQCGFEFDRDGEMALAREHIRRARRDGVSRLGRRQLWAEIAGQFAYNDRHGEFPTDQRAFVAHCVRFGIRDAVRSGGF